jgi:hypothetical protein
MLQRCLNFHRLRLSIFALQISRDKNFTIFHNNGKVQAWKYMSMLSLNGGADDALMALSAKGLAWMKNYDKLLLHKVCRRS